MRILALTIAAAVGAAFYLLPVAEASAQAPKMCAAKPTKPKKCVDWVCGTNGPCLVANGMPSATGCIKWKCNAVARKK